MDMYIYIYVRRSLYVIHTYIYEVTSAMQADECSRPGVCKPTGKASASAPCGRSFHLSESELRAES